MYDRRRRCGRDSESNDRILLELLSRNIKVDETESDRARNERWGFEFSLDIGRGGFGTHLHRSMMTEGDDGWQRWKD